MALRAQPDGAGPVTEDVTRLLEAASSGAPDAARRLLPIVYDVLRSLAQRKMAHESAPHTLQATALVHEAYLRLVRDEKTRWQNRRHFYAAAAEAMRRILIERARRRGRIRHGGGLQRVSFQAEETAGRVRDPRILSLDAALSRLEAAHPRKAEVVKLRYFLGMTIRETAGTLGVSPATVKLDWAYSRAWLHQEIDRSESLLGGLRRAAADSGPADSIRFGA